MCPCLPSYSAYVVLCQLACNGGHGSRPPTAAADNLPVFTLVCVVNVNVQLLLLISTHHQHSEGPSQQRLQARVVIKQEPR